MEVLRCRSDAMTLQVEASITSRTPAPSHCLNAIERFLDNRFAGGHLTTDDIVGEQLTQVYNLCLDCNELLYSASAVGGVGGGNSIISNNK